jgi:small multidrug resistance pump
MKPYFFLLLAILAEVAATSALKASDSFTKLIPAAIVIAGYVVSFYSLSIAVRTIPLGFAYALWSGIGIIFIVAVGFFFYRQSIDLMGAFGIGLIMAGVVVINLFSKSVLR